MKKNIIWLSIISLLVLSTGCSSTWDGVKKDTNDAWDGTKGAIHNATE